jgi:hypothetical protein
MKYLLYCIFRSPDPRGSKPYPEISGQPVFLLAHQNLGSLVSIIPDSETAPTISRVLAYGKVIDSIHRHRTVIPMRYGCLFNDESQIVQLLEKHSAEYRALLGELEGCVEMGIQVLQPANGPVSARNPDSPGGGPAFRKANFDHGQVHRGCAYLNARKDYYAGKDRITLMETMTGGTIGDKLSGLFVKCRSELRLLAGKYLMSYYFLVPKCSVKLFQNAFQKLHSSGTAKMLLSGPWPPYNFVMAGTGMTRTGHGENVMMNHGKRRDS